MHYPPRPGMTAEERLTVDETNRIVFADDRMPAVLSTPWLVAHLEYAARHAIAPCLTDDERSVGTYVEVEHLAPVPEGLTVTCRARVILVSGPSVTFQVEAHDGVDSFVGKSLEDIERHYITETLKLTAGNREEAAKLLGIGERTLYRKLKEYSS